MRTTGFEEKSLLVVFRVCVVIVYALGIGALIH